MDRWRRDDKRPYHEVLRERRDEKARKEREKAERVALVTRRLQGESLSDIKSTSGYSKAQGESITESLKKMYDSVYKKTLSDPGVFVISRGIANQLEKEIESQGGTYVDPKISSGNARMFGSRVVIADSLRDDEAFLASGPEASSPFSCGQLIKKPDVGE